MSFSAPVSAAHVPAPIALAEALSADWLTYALSHRFPGVVVSSIEITETIVTMATKVRFAVNFSAAPPATPRHFCLKGLFGDHVARMRASGVSETEARFYTEIAPRLTLRVPHCMYAGLAVEGSYAVILMDDLVVSGAHFLTALTPYSAEQAASSLDQLARLHAGSWAGRGMGVWPWLTSRLEYFARQPVMSTSELQALLDGERGATLFGALHDAARIERALSGLANRVSVEGHSLVHGDCHAGNVYETAEGASLIDWQLLQRGSWALDVSYHLGAVLAPAHREACERQLLAHYLDRLRAHGISPPTVETAWLEYRAHMIYGFYLWAITRKVAPSITNEFVRRLGIAVESLGSMELLEG